MNSILSPQSPEPVPHLRPRSGTTIPVVPEPMLPRPFRVRSRRRETRDTFTLVLEPADGLPVPSFAPGQFHMLYAFGCGEAAISLSGDPARTDACVHTIRAVGTVTKAFSRLRKGDMVGLRGAFGRGWPVDGPAEGGDILVVAGGIGLAPLRPAVLTVLARRERYRNVTVLTGARSPEERLYPAETARWANSGKLAVESIVDHAGLDWNGPVGVVTDRIPRASFVPAETTALVCGPEIMMRVTASALRRAGVPPERIFLSMERNMRCAAVQCGHCQFGPHFVCHDGPVFALPQIERWMGIPEV